MQFCLSDKIVDKILVSHVRTHHEKVLVAHYKSIRRNSVSQRLLTMYEEKDNGKQTSIKEFCGIKYMDYYHSSSNMWK